MAAFCRTLDLWLLSLRTLGPFDHNQGLWGQQRKSEGEGSGVGYNGYIEGRTRGVSLKSRREQRQEL